MKKIFKRHFHRFFIPGHHNNHHPPVVSHAALTAYLVLSVASFVIFRNIGVQTGNVLGFATDVSIDRVFELTNKERIANNVPVLTFNTRLANAAQKKAEDMFSKGYWAHFGPNGESPWNFILGSGYQYEYAGENLAKNYMTSGGIVSAWMASPTHKDNILNPNYKEIGVAMVNGTLSGEDTTLVVQMFGSKSELFAQNEVQSVPVNNYLPLPTVTPTDLYIQKVLVRGGSQTQGIASNSSIPTKTLTPSINLFPAFRLISSIALAFLITVFTIDLYHISKTQFTRHRGKHLAHIMFLVAVLIGIYFLGRGAIL